MSNIQADLHKVYNFLDKMYFHSNDAYIENYCDEAKDLIRPHLKEPNIKVKAVATTYNTTHEPGTVVTSTFYEQQAAAEDYVRAKLGQALIGDNEPDWAYYLEKDYS